MDGSSNKTMGDSSRTAATVTSSYATDDFTDHDYDFSDWNLDLDDVIGTKAPTPLPVASLSALSPARKQSVRRSKSLDYTSHWKDMRCGSNAPPVADCAVPPALTKSKSQRFAGRAAPKRSVSFDKVKIREFQQILGDAPSRDDGPSLALGWNYHQKKDTKVDKFEAKRTSMFSLGGRRKTSLRSLSPKERIEKACKLGFSLEEIQSNRMQNIMIQEQRKRSASDDERPEVLDPVTLIRKAQKAHGLKS